MDAFWRMTTEHTIFRVDYRASLRVACRSGRSASGHECAARRKSVTQSVTQGIPTLERAQR
ncbi:Unknown protein sequence [Pseudomonas syringae pv. berberidis]|nr:Unknown protein sequence [Pseudomonas syringae pv. berberidis]RMM21486.1 hypothetical protein ALQ83_05311 [Pseudomonas syringae pv. berberidis]